ncbi:MAG: hypothetical protein ACYTAN_14805 [Planctomycetota bacterium]|jgi:hypothetical protein
MRKIITLVASVILVIAVLVGVLAVMNARSVGRREDFWQAPSFTISEQMFLKKHVRGIIGDWRETRMATSPFPHLGGLDPRDHDVELVVDFDKQALWIEESGNVVENRCFRFPEKFTLSGKYLDPNEVRDLSGTLRLRLRGWDRPTNWPVRIALFAAAPDGTGLYIGFEAGSGVVDITKGFPTLKPLTSSWEGMDPSGTMVVSPEEHAETTRIRGTREPRPERTYRYPWEMEGLDDWHRAEADLYRDVEWQLQRRNCEPWSFEITRAPDGRGAHAELHLRRKERYWDFLNPFSRSPGRITLLMEHLGQGVWYVRSDPESSPDLGSLSRLEFLVCTDRPVSVSEEEWLKKGRARSDLVVVPESKWKTTLPNGLEVELLGVTELRGGDRQWWHPDGEPVGELPWIVSVQGQPPKDDSSRVIAVAFRMVSPGSRGGATRLRLENPEGSLSKIPTTSTDTYGRDIDVGIASYRFPATMDRFTLRRSFSRDGSSWQHIEFRDISLRPGHRTDFQIAVPDAAPKEP